MFNIISDYGKLKRRDDIERVKESNKTERLGDHSAARRQSHLIGGVVSEINRKKVWDNPKAQREIVDKVKSVQRWRIE